MMASWCWRVVVAAAAVDVVVAAAAVRRPMLLPPSLLVSVVDHQMAVENKSAMEPNRWDIGLDFWDH